jgi:DNA repair exonuclease SbcCD ATPase subunit
LYCAYGHGQVYVEGETEETKIRRERDRLAQQIAQSDDEIKRQRELRETAERQAAAARGQVTKLKNRASAGVCPCCNRTFSQLKRHMDQKHPDFTETDNVVVLRK